MSEGEDTKRPQITVKWNAAGELEYNLENVTPQHLWAASRLFQIIGDSIFGKEAAAKAARRETTAALGRLSIPGRNS